MTTYTPNWDKKPIRNKLLKLECFAERYFSYSEVRTLHSINDIQKKFGNQSPGHDLSIYLKELLLVRTGSYTPGSNSFRYMFSWTNLLWAFLESGIVTREQVKEIIEEKYIPSAKTSYVNLSLCLTVFQTEAKCKEFFDYRFFTEYNENMLYSNVEYGIDDFTGRWTADFQNTSKRIKAKFFAGYFDTDADAAAYTFVHQHYLVNVLPWWGKSAVEYKVIPLVYKDKTKFRNYLSKELGVSVDIVKLVLAAIMFDCKLVNNPFSGVYKILVKHDIDTHDFFKRAEACVILKELLKELRGMWAKCMSYWNNTNPKSGRKIFRSEKTNKETGLVTSRFKPSRFRSKIYYELERKIMDIVRKEMSGKLCHLMHDGFISKEKPDLNKIKLRIKEELNFNISFTMKEY